jgi:hypothetical protein
MVIKNHFLLNVTLENKLYKNLKMRSFTPYIIKEIVNWYYEHTQHFYRSSFIVSFEINHVENNIFQINFSYDTITLPSIEENLTNPDIFGKFPIEIGENKYNVIGRINEVL